MVIYAELIAPYSNFNEYDDIVVPANTETLFKFHIFDESYNDILSPLSYSWEMGDGTTYNTLIPEVSHTYTEIGTFWQALILTITELDGELRTFSFSYSLAIVNELIAQCTTTVPSETIIPLGESISATMLVENFKPESPNFEATSSSNIYSFVSSKIEEDIIVTKEEHKTEEAPYWENEYLHTIHFNGPCNRLGKFYLCAKFYKYKIYYEGS
jgi:hypothetical protein